MKLAKITPLALVAVLSACSVSDIRETDNNLETRPGNQLETDDMEPDWSDNDEEPVASEEIFDLEVETIEDDQCKLQQASYRLGPSLAAHFPPKPAVLPFEGEVQVDLFLVDWKDVKGTEEDEAFHKNELEMFRDFVFMVSEGKLIFNINVHDWTTIPGNSKDHYVTSRNSGGNAKDSESVLQPMLDHWIEQIDPKFDFTDTDMVLFGVPTASDAMETGAYGFGQSKERGYGAKVVTEERIIRDWIAAGDWFIDNPPQPPWIFYAHEWGHMVGLADYRDQEKQFLPDEEYQKYLANPMGSYEVMDNQGGPFRTFTSWVRWINGWLDDDQVTCVLGDEVSNEVYELKFLNSVGVAPKALVIKLSDTNAIVVESRRWDEKFDVPIVNNGDGVVVYSVDANKGHLEGGLRLLSPRDISVYLEEPNTFPDFRMLDAIMLPGDSVTVEGLTIEMVDLGFERDVVRLSK